MDTKKRTPRALAKATPGVVAPSYGPEPGHIASLVLPTCMVKCLTDAEAVDRAFAAEKLFLEKLKEKVEGKEKAEPDDEETKA
jgi:hypothetical protein